MSTADIQEFASRVEALYDQKLKSSLEKTHPNYFLAIEPESGDYFLGKTLTEAAQAARKAHPDKRSHLMRVGHKAAIHIGSVAP